MRKSLNEITREIDEIGAELAAMGEYAPQSTLERFNRLKDEASDQKSRLNALERRIKALRLSAQRSLPSYEAMTVEMPRWRTTILLALNSAAGVAVIGSDRVPAAALTPIILLFLAGAGVALLCGSILGTVGELGLQYHDELEKYDLDATDISEEEYDEAVKVSRKLAQLTISVGILRLASFAFFAGGVLLTAASVP